MKKVLDKDRKPVLELTDVSKIYGSGDSRVAALAGVSLCIYKGEYVAITGPSGSGKSTLMHILGLLDVPTSGEVKIDGVLTSGMSDKQLSRLRNEKIGFVFQQFNLLSRTSALQNVELPLVYRRVSIVERRRRALEVLGKLGMQDRVRNKPSELSGGQQQRVAIARALVTEPALLLADEPTGNLDSKNGEEVMKIFEKLHHEGVTVVLVTHDPDLAKRAKRQIVIKDGRQSE